MNIRLYMFWIRDFLKGSPIRNQYNEVKRMYYSETINNEYLSNSLDSLLKHASSTTDFYRSYKGKSLNEYPVMNKMIIKKNYESILSSKFKDKPLHAMSTSGSSGTPFTIKQDKRKRNRVIAEILFFGKICGYEFGMRQVFFRIWTEKNKKTFLQKILHNMVTEDVSRVSDDELKRIADILKNDKKIKNILSYASTLDRLSRYLYENNYKPNDFAITSIISGSEKLYDDTKKRLKQVFGCNVVSRYANQENGILAQQCINGDEFHLNNGSYYFEFLKIEEDVPASPGQIARVVVTDLYNYAMPMIRYDTGDLCIVKDKASCGLKTLVISELLGRKSDVIYDTSGNPISPQAISVNMWGRENIRQYKFIQLEKKVYKVLIVTDGEFLETDDLRAMLIKQLGSDADIEIELKDEIPLLPSGKRKYIENLYK